MGSRLGVRLFDTLRCVRISRSSQDPILTEGSEILAGVVLLPADAAIGKLLEFLGEGVTGIAF